MNTREQGARGVSEAINYFTQNQMPVFVPLFENQRCDLIVIVDAAPMRVECKTSGLIVSSGGYDVSLRTNGGNRSGTGKTKKISSLDTDLLFVYTYDGSKYLIPIDKVDGKSSITVGARSWNEYKV